MSGLLGGSWVVITRVISRATVVKTHIRGFITPLITTHEPPSRGTFGFLVLLEKGLGFAI